MSLAKQTDDKWIYTIIKCYYYAAFLNDSNAFTYVFTSDTTYVYNTCVNGMAQRIIVPLTLISG